MFRFTIRDVLWLMVVVGLASTMALANEWGDLSMRFAYDGEPPRPQPIKLIKDAEFCGGKQLVDESVLVNAGDHGLANVLVWLLNVDAALPVHPSYAADEQAVKL